jgi:hypothetical protein
MLSNVKKQYTTITLYHILEITAMLGIYWKEFDRARIGTAPKETVTS